VNLDYFLIATRVMQDPGQGHSEAAAQHGGAHAEEGFQAGEVIIDHVSNSGIDHPLIHFPTIFGVDLSVTKHVLMLWVVAAIVFVIVTATVRRYLKQQRLIPSGLMNGLEFVVEFIRDSIVLPNVGRKWVNTWAPLILTFFFFIVSANAIGMIPIFEVLGLLDRFVLHTGEESFLNRVIHGGSTATGNFNVTGGLAVITFGSIIVAGTLAHGFVKHWKNIVPHGLNPLIYVILIPIELLGMFVRPFALTMRLAANMTGGHIAILTILSFVFMFTETFGTPLAGYGVGFGLSVPLAAGVSLLEIIVVLVQAYVFTLLSAVFIGMAIHVHH
jgi:F-type H+-transporting ATPase subunit a